MMTRTLAGCGLGLARSEPPEPQPATHDLVATMPVKVLRLEETQHDGVAGPQFEVPLSDGVSH